MPDLSFRVEDVIPMRNAAVPTLAAHLQITNADAGEKIHSILLNCQVRIEPAGRAYTAEEEGRLLDLFGERERWARTMKPLQWHQTTLAVPAFAGSKQTELPLPCTLDFDVAATKYFYGLQVGEAPISMVFSGTVFYETPGSTLQVAQIPWDREARFRLSASAWKAAIEMHYLNALWIPIDRVSFDQLYRFKVAQSLTSWEQVFERLLNPVAHAQAADELQS